MSTSNVSLSDIAIGETARVQSISVSGRLRQRLLDIGLIPDTKIECVGISPLGDPRAYLIRGAVIAIRNNESRRIIVRRD